MAGNSSYSEKSWRELVEQIDGPDRHMDSLYPYVYEFGGGARRYRDKGPNSILYIPTED